MDTQLGIAVATGESREMMSCRRGRETRSAVDYPADLMAIEAYRLLDEVRTALDCDLITASKAAGRLAELLASKIPQEPRFAPARGGLAPWQKREVSNYIEDHLEGPIRVRDLAKRVSLSASYFSRAFRDSFGELPYTYIIRMKVERAQKLMLTTPSGLSQIAFACGLVDQAHLCRYFRQVTGTTPGGWRHSHAMGPASADIV